MKHVLAVAAGLAVAALAAWAVAPAMGAEPFSGEIDLALHGAVPDEPDNPDLVGNLVAYLECDAGRWPRFWAKGYTITEHPGLVESAEVADRTITLRLAILVQGDFWVKGQWPARYTVTLDRGADGTLSGRFEGEFAGRPASGVAEGRLLPPRPVREGFKRPAVDEHPRVLFRKSDIPRLKAKLETPFGRSWRKAVEAEPGPIGLGVLYQLTGDASYADRAAQLLRSKHEEHGGEIPVYGFGSGGFGHDIFEAAVAYDLCHDAWPASMHEWLRPQLEQFTLRQQFILMTSHANFHPCSNYYGPGRGVPGVVSMVLWGDPGDAPKPPRDPAAKAWQVTADPAYKPDPSVPVVDLDIEKAPDRWIWSGLLPFECSRDVLAKMGGYEAARPAAGAAVEYTVKSGTWFRTQALRFDPLPPEAATTAGIDLGKLSADGAPATAVFFTNVRAARKVTVRPIFGRGDVRAWISGKELLGDTLYDVEPGVHPLTVEVRAERASGLVAPVFVTVDPAASAGPMATYALEKALYDYDRAVHEATGMAPLRQVWLDRGWYQNFQHYRWGIGDGGFQAETGGYAQISSWYPSVYASCYPNFFGRAASPYPDVDHIVPRYIMQSTFPAGSNEPGYIKLESVRTLNLQWMACHFPIIPDRYKPSALWVWNYLAGGDGGKQIEALFTGKSTWDLKDFSNCQTFINYPLDMKPVDPAEGMPRTWRADTFGFYVFRSGFAGGEEFVSQVFAKASPVEGWNHPNAASPTVWGLGHPWTTAPESRNGCRELYSVVLLPQDEINQGSCARVVDYGAEPDGSGHLTLDMGDVYAAPSKGLYDGMFFRRPERFRPSGITGLRAFGYDYSGASGAPALVVIVDKIDGAHERLWTWHKPEGAQAGIEGRSFTLRYPDAAMQATFVSPADVVVTDPGSEYIEVGDERHGYHGDVNRIKAASKEGNFFVVLTFQKSGALPAVSVEGEGLGARVRVGGRIVRFDGRKIVFE